MASSGYIKALIPPSVDLGTRLRICHVTINLEICCKNIFVVDTSNENKNTSILLLTHVTDGTGSLLQKFRYMKISRFTV